MLNISQIVFDALDGLGGIPAFREYPQAQQKLPLFTFRLLSYDRSTMECTFSISVHAPNPEWHDQLAELIMPALAPLGFTLRNVQDTVDTHSGHFIRRLNVSAFIVDASQLLTVHVATTTNFLPLVCIHHLSMEPDTRTITMLNPTTSPPPTFATHKTNPGTFSIRASFIKNDPAQTLVRNAFNNGTSLYLRLSASQVMSAPCLVSRLSRSPLSFAADFLLTGPFI